MSRLATTVLIVLAVAGAVLVHPILALEAPAIWAFWACTRPLREDLRASRYVRGKRFLA